MAFNEKGIQEIFKKYDIRGLVPREINSRIAFKLGEAFGIFLGGGKRIVVGRDNRKSSTSLKNSLVRGLISSGCDVMDVGFSTSDMVAWAVKYLNMDAGVMVTASHLPAEWNGIKFFNREGRIYGIEELKKALLPLIDKKCESGKEGKIERIEILEEYIKAVISSAKKITRNDSLENMKIVFDGMNGMASLVLPKILKELNANLIEINTNFEEGFKKPPEPTEETVKELCQKVLETKADLGIICDGDADRVLFVDDRGNFVPGDESLILIAMEYSKPEEPIVFSLDTSQILIDHLKNQKKCKVVYSKIGDFFVTEKIIEHKANFGGQPNGHMKDPSFILYDSGPFFATLFSSLLAKNGKNLSSTREELPIYHKINISIPHENPSNLIQNLIKQIEKKECDIISDLDGLKFSYKNSVVLVRPSGSEKKLRINVESNNKTEALASLEEVKMWLKL
ncbi:MAG: hypothetical protein QW040_03450 [Candidatus Aenigmatarchaeota archaeon]